MFIVDQTDFMLYRFNYSGENKYLIHCRIFPLTNHVEVCNFYHRDRNSYWMAGDQILDHYVMQ